MSELIRSAYVRAARGGRTVATRLRLLQWLESSQNRWVRHGRTLFAIHDVDDLSYLDLPWWVYGATARVDAFLDSREGKARVFEFGSGASTIWLARRAGEVFSVEHDPSFSRLMASRVAGLSHVSLRHVAPVRVSRGVPATPSRRHGHRHLDYTDYVRAIDEVDGEFDLIVVDGRAREECLRRAAPRLAADGILVFDNCNRRRYQSALRASGLRIQRLHGAAPCLPYPSATALLTNPPQPPAGPGTS